MIMNLGFTHQALAKKEPSVVRAGVAREDRESYFYTGILARLGYASLKEGHPKLAPYSRYSFPKAGCMLGLLVGRQWMQYLATELALEWLISYGGTKIGLFSSQPIETDLSFYTLGGVLDCMPMIPLSDSTSLLGVFGIGYKKANIEVQGKKIFDSIGWKVIPRAGAGVVLDQTSFRILLKLLAEFNNLFQDDNVSVFRPALLLSTSISLKI